MTDIIQSLATDLKGSGKRVAFVECEDERILKASRQLADDEVCVPVLVGDSEPIKAHMDELGLSSDGIEFVDHRDEELRSALSAEYRAINPSYSEKRLARKMEMALQFAAMMVKVGRFDCLAAGIVHSSGEAIVAAQQFIGLADGVRIPSSAGYVDMSSVDGEEGRWIIVADCALNTDPDVQALVDIASCTARSYENVFDEEARVAFVSYSTCGSSDGPSVDRMREALAELHEREPGLKADGEFQLEVALVPEHAVRKLHGRPSEVAGRANVLIFPSLDAGNIAVKCMQVFGGTKICGPVLQGFSRPVTDFSRSARVDEVYGNVVLALAQGGAR